MIISLQLLIKVVSFLKKFWRRDDKKKVRICEGIYIMEDKFFDIDETMVEYAEMSGFDFKSGGYLAVSGGKQLEEYVHQPYTFKYGNYDLLDMFKSMFSKVTAQKG